MSCEKFHIADIAIGAAGSPDDTEISMFVDTDEVVTIHIYPKNAAETTFRMDEQGLYAIQHLFSDAAEKLEGIIDKFRVLNTT